jgi:hypothetical protein
MSVTVNQMVHPSAKLGQGRYAPTCRHIEFPFRVQVFGSTVINLHVSQAQLVRHVLDGGQFLPNGIHQQKLNRGKRDGEGQAREATPGPYVDHCPRGVDREGPV